MRIEEFNRSIGTTCWLEQLYSITLTISLALHITRWLSCFSSYLSDWQKKQSKSVAKWRLHWQSLPTITSKIKPFKLFLPNIKITKIIFFKCTLKNDLNLLSSFFIRQQNLFLKTLQKQEIREAGMKKAEYPTSHTRKKSILKEVEHAKEGRIKMYVRVWLWERKRKCTTNHISNSPITCDNAAPSFLRCERRSASALL